MAVQLLAYEVADLCLGKPPVRSLSASVATVADAIAALNSAGENSISLWSCDHASPDKIPSRECVCVGKICMVDIICYLCREENLDSPAAALKSPVTVMVPKVEGLVRHVDPYSSLLEAVDLIMEGAQNLVVPIQTNPNQKRLAQKSSSSSLTLSTNHNGREFCWLTQEDVIRFLLGLISLFSPIPTLSIATLGILSHDYPVVSYNSPARSALEAIHRSSIDQTSVAVVDEDGSLIGEISPLTLSAGNLMARFDCHGPPEELARMMVERLRERGLMGPLEGLYGSNCSSDEELASPTTPLGRARPYKRWCRGYSGRMVRPAEATVCGPGSSLVAVMIQAIARRVGYVWVVDEGCGMVGIVTFAGMLGVFRDCLESVG